MSLNWDEKGEISAHTLSANSSSKSEGLLACQLQWLAGLLEKKLLPASPPAATVYLYRSLSTEAVNWFNCPASLNDWHRHRHWEKTIWLTLFVVYKNKFKGNWIRTKLFRKPKTTFVLLSFLLYLRFFKFPLLVLLLKVNVFNCTVVSIALGNAVLAHFFTATLNAFERSVIRKINGALTKEQYLTTARHTVHLIFQHSN